METGKQSSLFAGSTPAERMAQAMHEATGKNEPEKTKDEAKPVVDPAAELFSPGQSPAAVLARALTEARGDLSEEAKINLGTYYSTGTAGKWPGSGLEKTTGTWDAAFRFSTARPNPLIKFLEGQAAGSWEWIGARILGVKSSIANNAEFKKICEKWIAQPVSLVSGIPAAKG